MTIQSLTDAQLERLYRRVYRRIADRLQGGLTFGIDRPTLRVCLPGWAAIIDELQAEFARRSETTTR